MEERLSVSKELSYANGDGKGLGRAINCQRCVVAHEARMRGYDVIARESWGFDDSLRNIKEWLKVFDYSSSDIRKCSGETYEEVLNSIKKIMQSFGEGARAVIWFNWKNKANIGHAIIAQCRENGIVVFGDPQKKSRAAARQIKQADFNK